MKQTVRSIAGLAGVSPATVSRILNGSEAVSAETRKKVLDILHSAGDAAPKKRSGHVEKGGNIGVLIMPGYEFDPRVILKKLSVTASRMPRRWNLLLLPAEIPAEELESKHLQGELSGLLLIGHNAAGKDLDEVLKHVPHVWLNSYRSRTGENSVLMGNEFAGRIAARYLLRRHCRRVLCLSVPSSNPGLPARIDGFRFEFFSREQTGKCTVLPIQLENDETLETCTENVLDKALSAPEIQTKLRAADGIFSPEDRLTAFVHRLLVREKVRSFPTLISCNRTPEYLAGLYPRPASIDLGAKTGAELG